MRVDAQAARALSGNLYAVPPGHQRVVIERDTRTWPPIHRVELDTVFAAGDTVTVLLPMVLFIQTEPADAQVYLDGRLLGRTPLWTVAEPSWQGKRLVFRKPGYRQTAFLLRDYAVGRLTVALQREALELPPASTAPDPCRWRLRTLISAAVTLGAGILAVELRNQANETYLEYQSTGSLRKMRELYDRTLRLDRYSAAAYGAFEVGFVVSFYCFLRWQAASQD